MFCRKNFAGDKSRLCGWLMPRFSESNRVEDEKLDCLTCNQHKGVVRWHIPEIPKANYYEIIIIIIYFRIITSVVSLVKNN